MWRALVLLTLVGCGGVQGPVDEVGCPLDTADWSGTATLESGCAGAPATLAVNGGGSIDHVVPGKPTISPQGVVDGMSLAIVGADVSCGRASYMLKVPPQ